MRMVYGSFGGLPAGGRAYIVNSGLKQLEVWMKLEESGGGAGDLND
jgi:hypothetical protein